MITLQVPTFDEFCDYKFVKFVKVKVKNKPCTKDYYKVVKHLPGITQGGTDVFDNIVLTKKPGKVVDFYDIRQGGKSLSKLKGYFVTVVE